jgi:adenine phosphoribosyltransferase
MKGNDGGRSMEKTLEQRMRETIRSIPDFPKEGILFRDITPLLLQPDLFAEMIDALWEPFASARVDGIAGIESRGFLLGAALALRRRLPLVPLRKPGKLPAALFRETYDLEYGQDALEMHKDGVAAGQRILLVDDLLATGGTAGAAARLIRKGGAQVAGIAFLVELKGLGGRSRLGDDQIHVLLAYD